MAADPASYLPRIGPMCAMIIDRLNPDKENNSFYSNLYQGL